jgi:thioesterase domain-containing protein
MDQHWNDAGGDSLKALHFWFRIEEALGMRLPLDAFDQNPTAREVILAIEKKIAASPNNCANAPDLPTIYYLPGTEGDVLMLTHFRAAFAGLVQFEVIDYPPWRQMIAAGATFDAIVNWVISQIPATKKAPICLLGHSYGGFVAQETARRLLEKGYRLGFVGLVDARRRRLLQQYNPADANARTHASMAARISRVTRRFVIMPKGTMLRLYYSARALFLERASLGMLHAAALGATLLPEKSAFYFHAHLIFELRLRALRMMTEKPLDAPVTLFRSGEYLNEAPDFGWKAFCPRLNVVNIGGNHVTIIRSPLLEILRDRIMEELNRSLSAAEGVTEHGEA